MSYNLVGSLSATVTVSIGDDLSGNFVATGTSMETAVNAALSYANSIGGGEVVIITPATLDIDDPIVFPGNSLILRGVGRGVLIDGDDLATGEHAIEITGRTDCVVRDLAVQTQGGGTKTSHCILIEDGSHRFLVENVWIIDTDMFGISINGTTINGGIIKDCKILGGDNQGIYVDMDAANTFSHLIIENNLITAMGNSGIMFDTTGAGFSNCVIIGNTIYSNGHSGLTLNEVDSSTIDGNTVITNTRQGIFLADSDNNIISNNIVSGNDSGDTQQYDGIYTDADSLYNIIVGNNLDGNSTQRRGISIYGEFTIIANNFIALSDYDGLLCNANYCLVSNNICRDNGQHAAGTYHEIQMGASSDYSLVEGNYVGSPGDSSEDGINLDDGATFVSVVDNYLSNGMGSGIALTANNDNCLISNNTILFFDDYGIEITAATCNDNAVIDNYCTGNGVSHWLNSGTSTYSEGNWGGGVVVSSLGWTLATIQASIESVEASGGWVYAPPGTYDENIDIDAGNITLYGAGRATLIQPTGAGSGITISGDYDHIVIRDLAIDTKTGASTGQCIDLANGCDHFLIDNVVFVDSDAAGVRITGTNIVGGIIINCVMLTCDNNGIYVAIDAGNSVDGLIISNNYLSGTGNDAIAMTADGSSNYRVIITDNVIMNPSYLGMDLSEMIECNISNNIIYNCGDEGISLKTTSDRNVIVGNLINTCVDAGIELATCDQNVVSNNVVIACATVGSIGAIDDSNGQGNIIVGNQVISSGGLGIRELSGLASVTNNYVYYADEHGIQITQNNTLLANNYIQGAGQAAAGTYHGIRSGSSYSVITGNTVCSPSAPAQTEDGIHCYSGGYNTIMGNVLSEIGGDGLELNSGNDYNFIEGNIFRDCDDYGIRIAAATCDHNYIGKNHYISVGVGRVLNSGTATAFMSKQYYVARDDDNMGNIPGKSITNGQTAYIAVHAPQGMQEIMGFNIYVIPNATQAAADWDLDTDYGAIGEAYNTHAEADAASTYNVTNNIWFAIDAWAKGMFASMVEEDTGGISVTVGTAGHDLTVVMAELYYI